MAEQISKLSESSENDPFTNVSQTGWNRFSRFLLINVLVVIAALLLIGAFTVWS
ncbi:MAG TPA: hypothetical protein PK231_04345 [Acidocella sp.]|nr:hypothetical protein [Acidocella sp.]